MGACIAGIGSRKTPKHILKMMVKIGEWCRVNQIYVRSGHAPGADYAFEKGAQDHAIVYLPWSGFNSNQPYCTKHLIILDKVEKGVRAQGMGSVHKFHPHADRLSLPVRKLMARNYFQVMGTKVKPNPVSAVVCWTPNGSSSGGTGQAIRMAEHYDIPVLDLGLDKNTLHLETITTFIADMIRLT